MDENEIKRPDEPVEREQAETEEAAASETASNRQGENENNSVSAGFPAHDFRPTTGRLRASAPWPWIAVALLAVAVLIFVLVRDNVEVVGNSKNEVVGRMDGATITKADLYDELVKQVGDAQAASTLDNLMVYRMVDLEAAKLGIKAGDEDIDAEIANFKKHFPTDSEFENALEQSGITMDELREQVSISVKLRQIFEPQIKPTDEQLQQFFKDNEANFETPELVRASHILLATKEEAEAVLAELKNGADFATVAKEKSTDPGSKDNGGDLNFFGHGDMNEQFETAAFKLAVGEISGVVESPNGFHIIKVTDKKAAVKPTYEEAKQQVKSGYLDQEIAGKITDWLAEKKKAYDYRNFLSEPEDDKS